LRQRAKQLDKISVLPDLFPKFAIQKTERASLLCGLIFSWIGLVIHYCAKVIGNNTAARRAEKET